MRILFLTRGLGWFRGTQRMFYESIKHFKSSGHEVLAWGYDECGETSSRIRTLGVEVLHGTDVIVEALSFHPDIVNIHRGGDYCEIETDILMRLKASGAKIIETSVFGRVDRHSEKVLDLSIQISRWDLYRWNRWKGRLDVLGVYLPYVVDTDSFVRSDKLSIVRCRQCWEVPLDAFVIGRAGKTSWDGLTDSILSVLEKYKHAYFVSVEDYNGAMPERLLSHSRVRQIPRLVSNQDLSEFYSSCSVFVSVSPFGESFGMVVAESMACGTPVVATANPECDNAQAEVVCHGAGGLLVAKGSDVAEGISILIDHPDRRNDFASRVRALTVSRYSRKVVCGMLDDAFGLVLSNASPEMYEERGFELDIPRDEIKNIIHNVIGKYALVPRLYQMQNLNWFWRRVYEIYDATRNAIKKCCICGG